MSVTCCIALSPLQWCSNHQPCKLSIQPKHHQTSITQDPTAILVHIRRIISHLCEKCGWLPEAVHLFGYGAGGSVCAEAALAWSKLSESKCLGSVISVNGPLLSFPILSQLSPTPCLLWRRQEEARKANVAFRKGFTNLTEEVVKGPALGMPQNQVEWLPIMKWACFILTVWLRWKSQRFWSVNLRRLQPWQLGQGEAYEVFSS